MAIDIQRREFISLLGGASIAWPLAARAQQPTMPVVGYLDGASPGAEQHRRTAAFLQGLKEAGYSVGENVKIEYRLAESRYERLPGMVADLVHRQVALLAGAGTPAALAAKAANPGIPIVFETAGDPIRLGLVARLNRPGGNITGVTQLASELVAKRLGLLHDMIPTAKVVALLLNPNDPRAETQAQDTQEAARAAGLQVHIVNAGTEAELDSAFPTFVQAQAGALIVGTGEFFSKHADQIVMLAARHALPAVYQYRLFAIAGGLVAYGASITESYRQTGIYAGRVLKGEKPAELPVLRPTRFELIINLKTAQALGLTIPPGVLAIADEVIE
jgi:putative ABC transport system substrate-binding protein